MHNKLPFCLPFFTATSLHNSSGYHANVVVYLSENSGGVRSYLSYITYNIFYIFFRSVFASRFGGRYVLFWASVIWSLSTLVTPEAAHVGLRTLLACRVILGLAEGMAFPSTYHIFGESSADERSRNIGALHAGGFVGMLISSYSVEIRNNKTSLFK